MDYEKSAMEMYSHKNIVKFYSATIHDNDKTS